MLRLLPQRYLDDSLQSRCKQVGDVVELDVCIVIGILVVVIVVLLHCFKECLHCTGTPGAVPINPGDTVQAVVEHLGTLTHPVR